MPSNSDVENVFSVGFPASKSAFCVRFLIVETKVHVQ